MLKLEVVYGAVDHALGLVRDLSSASHRLVFTSFTKGEKIQLAKETFAWQPLR